MHLRRRLAVFAVLLGGTLGGPSVARAQPSPTPQTGRLWLYGSLTVYVHPEWSLFVMPGYRYEFARSPGEPLRNLMTELFVGPNFQRVFGALRVRTSLWYYYTGFFPGRYADTQSFEIIVTLDWTLGRFVLTNRNIFHNTVYATVYDAEADRRGYGLVMRNLFQARCAVHRLVGVLAAIEPFFGLAKAGSVDPHPFGYWKPGPRLNRVHAGVEVLPVPGLALSLQYVYETALAATTLDVAAHNHYLFFTVGYVLRAYRRR